MSSGRVTPTFRVGLFRAAGPLLSKYPVYVRYSETGRFIYRSIRPGIARRPRVIGPTLTRRARDNPTRDVGLSRKWRTARPEFETVCVLAFWRPCLARQLKSVFGPSGRDPPIYSTVRGRRPTGRFRNIARKQDIYSATALPPEITRREMAG